MLNYFQKRQCLSCKLEYIVSLPLVEDEHGEYRQIQNRFVGNTSLQRLVWEWYYKVPPTGIIHHLNGKKRDNRPCNLYEMARGHSAYKNGNSSLHKIQVLKHRILELETELDNIKNQSKFDI